MNEQRQQPDLAAILAAIDQAVDEIEKQVLAAKVELGDCHVPLWLLHYLAGKCLEAEKALLGLRADFRDVEQVAEVVARSFSRLQSLDILGHDFRELCDLAEAASNN